MKKDAWVLRLKKEYEKEQMIFDGKPLYFTDDESEEFMTDDLQSAAIIDNKKEMEEELKIYERYMKEKYGEDVILNFGYTNMMRLFEWVEVEVEESE